MVSACQSLSELLKILGQKKGLFLKNPFAFHPMKSLTPKIKKANFTDKVLAPKIHKTKHKEAHSSNTKFGMGDYYGTGVRQPFGKMRGDSVGMYPVSKKKLKTPPRSVV